MGNENEEPIPRNAIMNLALRSANRMRILINGTEDNRIDGGQGIKESN